MLDLRVGGIHPDIMILLPIVAGLVGGPGSGASMGFGAGLVADLFLPTPFGLSALVGCLIGFAVGVTTLALDRTAWWLAPTVALGGSAVYEVLYALLGSVLGQPQMLHVDLTQIVVVVSRGQRGAGPSGAPPGELGPAPGLHRRRAHLDRLLRDPAMTAAPGPRTPARPGLGILGPREPLPPPPVQGLAPVPPLGEGPQPPAQADQAAEDEAEPVLGRVHPGRPGHQRVAPGAPSPDHRPGRRGPVRLAGPAAVGPHRARRDRRRPRRCRSTRSGPSRSIPPGA